MAFLLYFPKVPSEGSQTINGSSREEAKTWTGSTLEKFPRRAPIPSDFIARAETARAEIPRGTTNQSFLRVPDAIHPVIFDQATNEYEFAKR